MVHSLRPALVNPSKKVHRLKKDSFVVTFWPVYFCSRYFGFLPFSLVFDSNGEIRRARVGIFDIVWFIMSIGLYLCLAILYIQMIETPQDPTASFILFFGDTVFNVVAMLLLILMAIMDMCNRNKLVDIVKTFSAFDKEVSSMKFHTKFHNYSIHLFQMKIRRFGIEVDYKAQLRRIILWCITNAIAVLLLLFSVYVNQSNTFNGSTFKVLVYLEVRTLQFMATSTVFSTYSSLILRLRDRFELINDLLK